MSVFETDYKNKYLKSLEELEQKEKSWELAEASLRRCISRLSFVGDGRNRKMDRRLEELRNRVRHESDLKRLQRMVEALAEMADKLEPEETPPLDLSGLSDGLVRILDEAPFPVSLKRRVKALRGKIRSEPLHEDNLTELRSLVIEGLQVKPPAEGGEKKAGLFGKLFHKEQPAEAAPPAHAESVQPDVEKTAPQVNPNPAEPAAPVQENLDVVEMAAALLVELIDRLKHVDHWSRPLNSLSVRARNAGTERALNALVKELAEILQVPKEIRFGSDSVLLSLLEQIDLPRDLEPKVTPLKTQLAEGVEEEKIPRVLKQMADVLGQARRDAEKERQEVEEFLLQLTQQLQELDVELDGVGTQGREIYEGSKRFGESMDSQVSDLHASVADATDLDDLKNTVFTRLQKIQEHMRNHRAEEDQRSEQFETDIVQLKSRLQEMESESDDLKRKVDEARAQAFSDALTGLNNRHAFDVRMEQEYARWKRYQTPLSIIVLDVDFFKRVNDTYGHSSGDKVLRVIGNQVRSLLREVDFPARYGGEEFVILLPETELFAAHEVAEKVRLAVEEKGFHAGDKRVTITLSCGVAELGGDDSQQSLFERADNALYLAKSSGRNRTCTQDDLKAE